jgi:outer membrane protein
MRNRVILSIAAVFFVGLSYAQNVKIGYTNVDYIISAMPEAQEIEQQLSEYEKKFTAQMQSKYQTFQEKYGNYQQNAANMTLDARREIEMELQSLQGELQKFQQDAETMMMRKQQELLDPVLERVQKAIEKVAAEKGYTHILRAEAMLFSKNDSDDISDTVLEALGVEPPAKR